MNGLTEKQHQEIQDAVNKGDMSEINAIFNRIIEENEREKDEINKEFNKARFQKPE